MTDMTLSTATVQALTLGKLDLFTAISTGIGLQEGETAIIWQMVEDARRDSGVSLEDDLQDILYWVQQDIVDAGYCEYEV